jgi:hypothetical protein
MDGLLGVFDSITSYHITVIFSKYRFFGWIKVTTFVRWFYVSHIPANIVLF